MLQLFSSLTQSVIFHAHIHPKCLCVGENQMRVLTGEYVLSLRTLSVHVRRSIEGEIDFRFVHVFFFFVRLLAN